MRGARMWCVTAEDCFLAVCGAVAQQKSPFLQRDRALLVSGELPGFLRGRMSGVRSGGLSSFARWSATGLRGAAGGQT